MQINDNSRKLLLFFILTFTISWSIWFLAPLFSLGDFLILNWICLIGVFGPSISATILASRIKSPHKDNQKKKRWSTFSIILIVSFLSALISFPLFYAPYSDFSLVVIIFYIIASVIASFLISGVYSSNPGISDLLQPIKGVKGNNIFLLIAFILPLLISICALIFVVLGGTILIDVNYFIPLLSMTLVFPHVFFFGGGNEESFETLAEFAETSAALEKERKTMLTPLLIIPIIGAVLLVVTATMFLNFFSSMSGMLQPLVPIVTLRQILVTPLILHDFLLGLVTGKIVSGRVSSGFKIGCFLVLLAIAGIWLSPLMTGLIEFAS